jgi:cobalt-zinc-cadmium efflux system protein
LKWLRHPAVYWVASIGLGAVFIYASLDKIARPLDFARIIYRYQLAGPSAALGVVPANTLAVVLPWLEAVIGVLLVTGLWRREAAAITGGLLVVFLVAVGYVLWQGIDVGHCGCFTVGGEGRSAGWTLIAGDLGLLAVALYVALVPPRTAASVAAAEPVAAV